MILRECLYKIPKQVTRRKVGVKANSDVHFIDMQVCPQQSPKELESSNEELKSTNEELESFGKLKFRIHGRIINKDKDFPYRVLLQFVKQGRKANRAGVPQHFR
jgi:hypothetical protein